MKPLALLVVVAIVACKSDKPPAPAPTPTEIGSGSGSSVVIAAGSGSAGSAGSGSAGSGSAACVIKVTLNQTNIAWDGGGIKGQNDFKPGEPPHLDALRGLTCPAWLIADDKMRYQDVISVMDALIMMGIVEVSLSDPTKTKSGTVPARSDKQLLKEAPVLVITKTEVRFHDKLIGTPDDDAIATKLAAELPKDPKDPTFVIQADKDTSAKTINRVITGASNQGYTNVMFGVQNK
jgi:biopolymer transport protein ExbD